MKGEYANNQALRRSCRVLAMVHELHKMGYQHLAIYPGRSPCGNYWRCEILPFQDLLFSSKDGLVRLANTVIEEASYSSGDSNLYFGWSDARQDSARELAAKFIKRFPVLCAAGRQYDFRYAGWLTFVLGESERGRLPVMFSDSTSYDPEWMGSPNGPVLFDPPHYQLREGQGFQYARLPMGHDFLVKNDWHTAYQEIVQDMVAQCRVASPVFVPKYPIRDDVDKSDDDCENHFEIGAYWEGAVYFIQKVLGYTDVGHFLSDYFAGNHTDSIMWRLFLVTWDYEGQLELLLAFFARYALSNPEVCNPDHMTSFKSTQVEDWLEDFNHKHSAGIKYPNPYFGGSNPLHLGFILLDPDGPSQCLIEI